jgi:hypothetical protein
LANGRNAQRLEDLIGTGGLISQLSHVADKIVGFRPCASQRGGDGIDIGLIDRKAHRLGCRHLREQCGKGNASTLTTAELPNRFAPVEVVEQTGDDIAHLGIACPHVFGLIADHGLTNRHVWVETVGLSEHANAQIVAVGDSPAVWLESLRENLHQSRFAVTVSTDDANSITLVDADGYRLENFFRRKLE